MKTSSSPVSLSFCWCSSFDFYSCFIFSNAQSILSILQELKMAVHRFQMASNKKSALLKQSMRDVAILLAEDPPKEEKARIKAEALIRDDNLIEAFDILSLTCELLSERLKLITFSKECPPDLVSSVATLIYAAPRVDIPELQEIRKQFRAKYGKKFEDDAMKNVGGVLNERVLTKLSVQPPAAYLVQTYLQRSCEKYEVKWSPTIPLAADKMGQPMAPPVGLSVPIGRGTGLGPEIMATTGGTVFDEEITYDGTAQNGLPPLVVSKKDDFAEPDIFIPGSPSMSKASNTSTFNPPKATPSAPTASLDPRDNHEQNEDDEDEDENGNTPGQSDTGTGPSYQDLAARFESLKNI
jgi:vacuolar protein sorting-associated protein IST1